MDIVYPVACGLDVHKASVTACLRRVGEGGAVTKEISEFETTHSALVALRQWLLDEGCPVVAMESTGVYWKPVFNVLQESLTVIVGNAYDMRRPRRGRKTDKLDAVWISELLSLGLIVPSFVPEPRIRQLRDLMRLRTKLVQQRAQAKNRVHKTLEDANIKLGNVASDIFGKSGRAMLEALIGGQRDPEILADLALRRMRSKLMELRKALDGRFTEHHATLVRLSLEQVDLFNRQLDDIDASVNKILTPEAEAIEHLITIPGIEGTGARTLLAEIGPDVSLFGSAARLTSWAGLAPGQNETGGKAKRAPSRRGNRYLRRLLVQCAWAAAKTDTHVGLKFRQLRARIGAKRAAVAIARKILVIVFHVLNEGTSYDDTRYELTKEVSRRHALKRAAKILKGFGYDLVSLPEDDDADSTKVVINIGGVPVPTAPY